MEYIFSSYLRNEIEKRESNTVLVNRAEAGRIKRKSSGVLTRRAPVAADYANINPGERLLSGGAQDGVRGRLHPHNGIILFAGSGPGCGEPLAKQAQVLEGKG